MDLIDASNVSPSATIDPVTGNTVAANATNGGNMDTVMNEGEPAASTNNTGDDVAAEPFTDNTPTVYDFDTLPSDTKARISRLLSEIGHVWSVASPATPFPPQYLPDPDTHNWGHALLSAINRLAQLTRGAYKTAAVYQVIKSMKERNDVPGNMQDEGMLSCAFTVGEESAN